MEWYLYSLVIYALVVFVIVMYEVIRCLRSALCRNGLEYSKFSWKYDLALAVLWLPLLLFLIYVRIMDYISTIRGE